MSRLLRFDEIRYISKFIISHFNYIEFQAFLIQRTEIDYFNHMPMVGGFDTGVPLFIDKMSKNYKIPIILLALESKFPDESKIKQIILDLGLSYQGYENSPDKPISDTSALQNLLNNEEWFDTDTFFNKLGEKKRCVCRVEVPNLNGGLDPSTGFLISPNQVMTNYHVVQPVLNNPTLLKQINCRFDFEKLADDSILNNGTSYPISQNKPIELFSEYCSYDTQGEPNLKLECDVDKLDFAIINLETEVGNLPFGIKSETEITATNRGWIKLKPTNLTELRNSSSLIILQHPAKNPLKMAIGLDKLIGISPNERRIRYNINTLPGSSGSPVFNTDFELVALHNMGDPSFIPIFNQGIVLNRIIDFLESKNYTIQV